MSTVHIDHRALHEVNGDIDRVTGSVESHIRGLRAEFARLGVPTANVDAVLRAHAELDRSISPALRGREREARELAQLPYSGALQDDLAARGLEIEQQPPVPSQTSISALTGGSATAPAPVQFIPEHAPEPPQEDPPLFSIGGIRNLGGQIWGGVQDGWEWATEKISETWDTLAQQVSEAWEAMATWWEETTAHLGAWIDENLDGVRQWIKDNVIILRVIAIIFKVVGWVLVVVGAVLLILSIVASLTGIGALAGVPGAGVAIALMGGGAALIGAGEMVDTVADWGEGTIDGQELVQQLALEGAFTVVSALIPGGVFMRLGRKLLDALPSSMRRKVVDFFERLFSNNPGRPRPPRGPHVDVDALPDYMQPRPLDRSGPDRHLYPDDYHPYGSLSEQEFYDTYVDASGGSARWRYPPDDGFAGTPQSTTVETGTVIDRFGSPNGSYVSPEGTPFDQRALPPSSANFNYTRYEVVRPIPNVNEGEIAEWFEQPGGGWQYHLPHDVQWYLDNGYLVEVP